MSRTFDYLLRLSEGNVQNELLVKGSVVSFLDVEVLGGSYYIRLENIKEVIANPDYTNLSHAKPWFLGLLKVQNEVYSVVDLEGFFYKKKNSSGRFVVVLSSLDGYYSLAVRGINGIVRVENPEFIQSDSSLYESLSRDGGKVRVLDIDYLIRSEEFNDVSLFNV